MTKATTTARRYIRVVTENTGLRQGSVWQVLNRSITGMLQVTDPTGYSTAHVSDMAVEVITPRQYAAIAAPIVAGFAAELAGEARAMTSPTYRDYVVTVQVQFPAWDEKDGIRFYVSATSKADAIKQARRENSRGGQVHSQQGRAVWSASLVEA